MDDVDAEPHNELSAAVQKLINSTPNPTTPDGLVAVIRRANEVGHLSQAHLQRAVLTARAEGVSWQAIGDTLGISRQAAFKKFDPAHHHVPGEAAVSNPIVDLIERTESVFRSLNDGDFDTVRSMMTYSCARSLTKKKLAIMQGDMVDSFGQLESISGTVIQPMDGRDIFEKLSNQLFISQLVGDTRLNHEAGEWNGRVAFNKNGKVTGILVSRPNSGPTQF